MFTLWSSSQLVHPLLSCPFWILLVFSDSMSSIRVTYESMCGKVVYRSTDTLPVAISLTKISLPLPEGSNCLHIFRVLGVGVFLCPSLLHDGISIGPIFCKYCVALTFLSSKTAKIWTSKLVQWVRLLVTWLDDRSLITGTRKVEWKNWLPQFSFDLHMWTMAHTSPSPQTKKVESIFLKRLQWSYCAQKSVFCDLCPALSSSSYILFAPLLCYSMKHGGGCIDVLFTPEYSSPYHEHVDQLGVSVVTPVSIAMLKMQTWRSEFDTPNPCKTTARHSSAELGSQLWGGRNRRVLGACWSANLIKSVCSWWETLSQKLR